MKCVCAFVLALSRQFCTREYNLFPSNAIYIGWNPITAESLLLLFQRPHFFLFSLACLRARLPSVHVLDKLMALFLASFLFNSFVSARLKSMIAPMCSTKCLPLHVNVICVEQGLLINFFRSPFLSPTAFFSWRKPSYSTNLIYFCRAVCMYGVCVLLQ